MTAASNAPCVNAPPASNAPCVNAPPASNAAALPRLALA
jgi:hypothetical protein